MQILAYCLMPNHVHVEAVPDRVDSLAKALGARTTNTRDGFISESARPAISGGIAFSLALSTKGTR